MFSIFALLQAVLIATTTALQPEFQKIYNVNDPSAIPNLEPPAQANNAALLDVVQIYTPVRVPSDANCKSTLMVYSFASSYDRPFVGK
jgi:hypothetical protein